MRRNSLRIRAPQFSLSASDPHGAARTCRLAWRRRRLAWRGGGWHGGGAWHGGAWGWHGNRWSCCWRGGVFIGVPPVYVPPPVYYPPPVTSSSAILCAAWLRFYPGYEPRTLRALL